MNEEPPEPYTVQLSRGARRALTEAPPIGLKTAVAMAAHEFIVSRLPLNPHRIGKPLLPPRAGEWSARMGTFRVLYEIQEERRLVRVLAVEPRADAYRT